MSAIRFSGLRCAGKRRSCFPSKTLTGFRCEPSYPYWVVDLGFPFWGEVPFKVNYPAFSFFFLFFFRAAFHTCLGPERSLSSQETPQPGSPKRQRIPMHLPSSICPKPSLLMQGQDCPKRKPLMFFVHKHLR